MSNKKLGEFKTGRALNLLFDRFSYELTKEELEFFARGSEYAELQADNMAHFFNTLASLAGHEGALEDVGLNRDITDLFWQTAYIFDEIAGLIHMSSNAAFMLKNPDAFKAPDKIDPQ